MGLDMYLSKRTYVKNWDHMQKEEKHRVYVSKNGKSVSHIKPKRVAYIIEEVLYWRKANHIHKWFVDNVQKGVDDCGTYYVEMEKLKQLRDLCKDVIERKGDSTNAPRVLPTQSGFFFGGTEYDKYYYDDTQRTLETLDELIKEHEEIEGSWKPDYEYHASW